MFYWNKNSEVPLGKTEKVKSVFLSEADGVQEFCSGKKNYKSNTDLTVLFRLVFTMQIE